MMQVEFFDGRIEARCPFHVVSTIVYTIRACVDHTGPEEEVGFDGTRR